MGANVFEDDIEDAGAETRVLKMIQDMVTLKQREIDDLRDEIIMLNSEISKAAKMRKGLIAERDALQGLLDRLTKGLL